MKVYFIPGLGADKRVFRHIELPEGFDMVHIEWLPPHPGESLRSYANRLLYTIDKDAPFALVGLSFGGMLATEISRQLQPEKTILIASLPSAANLPPYFKICAPLQLHKILPIGLFKNASLAKRLFTTETNEDKELLRTIIRETDPAFIRWAIGAILYWENAPAPEKIFHIHGTRDHLLPLRYVRPTHHIEGGGHLMVMNRAKEVNKVLAEILRERKS
jgi:pimeloyl-ACP methyl ester carboxylesterase